VLQNQSRLSADLLLQELGRRTRSISLVGEVGRREDKSSNTDHVTSVAEDLQAVTGQRRNALLVLLVLCVSEENHALDLLAHLVVELGDRACNDSGALAAGVSVCGPRIGMGDQSREILPVSARDNRRVGALLVSLVEHLRGLVDGTLSGTVWERVLNHSGGVGRADALDPYLAVLPLQSAGDNGTSGSSLEETSVRWNYLKASEYRTMLPCSPLARAKMKMALGQLELDPLLTSLLVIMPS
jgi:hypothetical protein